MQTLPNTDDLELATVDFACAFLGGDKPLDRSTYYRGIRAGRFPKPIKIGGKTRVVMAELKATVKAAMAARDLEAV